MPNMGPEKMVRQPAGPQHGGALLGARYEALYAAYYSEQSLRKREISASQTVAQLRRVIAGSHFSRLLDVGAGEGSVLFELDRAGIGEELYAVEISRSGVERLRAKGIPHLKGADLFDGYRIPYPDKHFDLAIAIHVLEHIEHERLFLRELGRVARRVYVEVPLELRLKVDRAISFGRQFGHINFYTPATLGALLQSTGLDVERRGVFAASMEYEALVGGQLSGRLKHLVRSLCLKVAPGIAPWLFTYIGYALCNCP